MVQKLRKPTSEVCHRFEPVPQVLRKRSVQRRQAAGRPAGGEADFGRDRPTRRPRPPFGPPSGTEPVISVMGEADDEALVTLWTVVSAKRSPAQLRGWEPDHRRSREGSPPNAMRSERRIYSRVWFEFRAITEQYLTVNHGGRVYADYRRDRARS